MRRLSPFEVWQLREKDISKIKPTRSPSVTYRFWKDLLLVDSGFFLEKNVELDIFFLCNGERTVEDICNIIANKYHINYFQAKKDVDSFIKQLLGTFLLWVD